MAAERQLTRPSCHRAAAIRTARRMIFEVDLGGHRDSRRAPCSFLLRPYSTQTQLASHPYQKSSHNELRRHLNPHSASDPYSDLRSHIDQRPHAQGVERLVPEICAQHEPCGLTAFSGMFFFFFLRDANHQFRSLREGNHLLKI